MATMLEFPAAYFGATCYTYFVFHELHLRKPWKDTTQVEDQGLYLGLKHGREGRVPPGRCSRAPEESPIE